MNSLKRHVNHVLWCAGLIMTLTVCNGYGVQYEEEPELKPTKNGKKNHQAADSNNMNIKQQVDFAVADLASRMNMDPHEVGYSGMTPVLWRSSAVGCPEPGLNYTQALVRGVLIMLRVGNKPYRYHGVPAGQPFFCPDERAEPPVPGQNAD